MKTASLAAISLLLTLGLGACGGSGDGAASTPAPGRPAAPPATAAPTTLSAAGVSGVGCLSNLYVQQIHFDDAGNAVVFWCDSLGGVNRLNASTLTSGQRVVVAQGFTATGQSGLEVRAIGTKRFAVLHQMKEGTPGTVAQVLDFTSASPTASTPVVMPSNVTSTSVLLKDTAGALTIVVDTQATPFPTVSLGGSVNARIAAPAGTAFAQKVETAWRDGTSAVQRGVWGVTGRLNPTDPANLVDVFVADVNLATGAVATPTRVSTASFLPYGSVSKTCFSPLVNRPVYRTTSAGQVVAGWSQLNANGLQCELMVQGVRVSEPGTDVGRFAFSSGQGGELFAVWSTQWRASPLAHPRIVWSRRDPATLQWSAPASIAPAFDTTGLGQNPSANGAFSMVAGDNGTFAVSWDGLQAQAGQSGVYETTNPLVSKFANGSWSTFTRSTDLSNLAISPQGQGVALGCNGANCNTVGVIGF